VRAEPIVLERNALHMSQEMQGMWKEKAWQRKGSDGQNENRGKEPCANVQRVRSACRCACNATQQRPVIWYIMRRAARGSRKSVRKLLKY